MSASSQKKPLLPGIEAFGFLILAVPVALIIASALWLTATAAYENIKFLRGTEQIFSLIGLMREDASVAPNFGKTVNEDLIDDLMRLGQYSGRPADPWGGAIRAVAPTPGIMRIELDI